jgi:hypothetical protein
MCLLMLDKSVYVMTQLRVIGYNDFLLFRTLAYFVRHVADYLPLIRME